MWLIELLKENTIKDFNNGYLGRYQIKSILVEKDIKQEINIDNGWKIKNIIDWNKLQEKQLLETIKWIFDH